MTDVTVRETTVEDAPAVRRIADAGWRAAYGDVLARETIDVAMAEWYDPEATRTAIEREDGVHLVAERDPAGVMGFAAGGPGEDPDVAALGAIYVAPDRWREGIGTALFEAFEAACRERGHEELRFRVLAENEVGIAFYRSRGYDPVTEEETELFGEQVRELAFRGTL